MMIHDSKFGLLCWLLLVGASCSVKCLQFKVDKFTDLSDVCREHNGKPPRYILDEDNPAVYVSIDPGNPVVRKNPAASRYFCAIFA